MGDPDQAAPRSPARAPALGHSTAVLVSVVALALSVLALLVTIVQTNLARDDARAARRTSTNVVEGLARKVFFDTDFTSVTVSNIGTLPIRDVTIYRTDDRGRPTAVYEFEGSVPGCTSYRWEGPVRVHLAVGFRVVDGGLWLLSDSTGLHEQRGSPVATQSLKQWNLAISAIRLCS